MEFYLSFEKREWIMLIHMQRTVIHSSTVHEPERVTYLFTKLLDSPGDGLYLMRTPVKISK